MAPLFRNNSIFWRVVINKLNNIFHTIHKPNGTVQLWLTIRCSRSPSLRMQRKILDSTGHMILSIKLNVSTSKQFQTWRCTCSSVWNCIVLPINTGQHTSPMHQYCHIHSTHYLVTVRQYKTPAFWVGSIHIARLRYSVSSPEQRAERYNWESIIWFHHHKMLWKKHMLKFWHYDSMTQASNQRCYIIFNKDFGLNKNFQSLSNYHSLAKSARCKCMFQVF
jgi:hypothetical protein